MKLTIYQVDAFANKLFGGNPAAVIPLDNWIDDLLMQQIAEENNLAETVFFVPKQDGFHIRWFTPELEIDLCGHATLATAFVLFELLNYQEDTITFYSQSGPLKVYREGTRMAMDFPSWKPERVTDYPEELLKGLGITEHLGVYKNRDYIVELETEKDVIAIRPDLSLLNKIDVIGIIITAPGTRSDFVSRFFAPNCGIPEDPVTGSSHSQLIPFWAEKLGKNDLHALQLSKRGGELWCEQKGDRVIIKGKAVFYMKGEIDLNGV
ncbi:MAG: PhzF family phenazine biosynthesis protein [Ferruginibacter sp.]